MLLRRTLRVVVFFAPLLLFVAALMSPQYSARLSLMLHGHPFATVVPKEQLDIFKFVGTDSFACRAIVFSHDKAIGSIFLPSTGGFPEFVPFDGDLRPMVLFQMPLVIAWALRWWLLAAQGVFLLVWLWMRLRTVLTPKKWP